MCVHLYLPKQVLQVQEAVWHSLENIEKLWHYKMLCVSNNINFWEAIQFVIMQTPVYGIPTELMITHFYLPNMHFI